MVESQPSKLLVAGSIPVSRSSLCAESTGLSRELPWVGPDGATGPRRSAGRCGFWRWRADVAQLAERVLGKDEVTGSIPVIGSICCESGCTGAT